MKYTDIFKKWWFWILTILYTLGRISAWASTYETVGLTEIIALFIGSFIVVTFSLWVILAIYKGIKKITKR